MVYLFIIMLLALSMTAHLDTLQQRSATVLMKLNKKK